MKYPIRLITISTAVTNNLRRISLLKNDSAALLRTERRRTRFKNLFLNIFDLGFQVSELVPFGEVKKASPSFNSCEKVSRSRHCSDVALTFIRLRRHWFDKQSNDFSFTLETKGLLNNTLFLPLNFRELKLITAADLPNFKGQNWTS